MSAEKIAERLKIQQKMNALDNEYFDLADSEIDEFQQLLDDDDTDGSIEWQDENDDFPQPFNFKSERLHLEKISEKPTEETIEECLVHMESEVSIMVINTFLSIIIDRVISKTSQQAHQKHVPILIVPAKDQMRVCLKNQMEHRLEIRTKHTLKDKLRNIQKMLWLV